MDKLHLHMYYAINYFLGEEGERLRLLQIWLLHVYQLTHLMWLSGTHILVPSKKWRPLTKLHVTSAHTHDFTSDIQTDEDFYHHHENTQTFTGKTVLHI